MSEPAPTPATHEEALGGTGGDELLHGVVSREMGDEIAAAMSQVRRLQERYFREAHPGEGLRERKRRLTRQLISDVATTLCATRGFDNVRVSDVAELVGVSEKTVYNYFPTKESLVLDNADEGVERLAKALRERPPNEPLTTAAIAAMREDGLRYDAIPEALVAGVPLFWTMINETPSLRAAWLELHDRLAQVARDELAAQAEIDPRDPEPTTAGRALAGLVMGSFESQVRHIQEGKRGAELRAAVEADLERAAGLLETGLWSFRLLTAGRRKQAQVREAAQAADEVRRQVLRALREARSAWAQLRGDDRPDEKGGT